MRAPLYVTGFALLALGCRSAALPGNRLDAALISVPDGPADVLPAPELAPLPDGVLEAATPTLPAGATIVAAGQASPCYLALDGDNVYWLNLGIYDSPAPKVWWWNGAQIIKCPKLGCPEGPTTLVSGRLIGYGSTLLNIATDGEYVFWSDDGPDMLSDGGGTAGGLLRCSVAGCDNTPELLDDIPARGLAVSGGGLYVTHAYSAELEACLTSGCASPPNLLWSEEPSSTNTRAVAVAADASDVYWTTTGRVMRCARGGCDNTPTILASSGDAVWNLGPIALDASTVYFGHGLFTDGKHQYDGEILACAKTGCAGSPTLVAGSAYGPYRLATDGLHVYWTEQDASLPNSASSPFLLRRCPTTGCGDAPVTLVSGLTGPSDVAVDEAYVYWTDGGSRYDASGRVWRAPK